MIKNIFSKIISSISASLISILFFLVFILLVACYVKPAERHDIEFLNDVFIKPYHHYTWLTANEISVIVDDRIITVPSAFETDLASIPRIFWPFMAPQYASFVYPAILHDYLYRCSENNSRSYADAVFYYALLNNGVSKYTAGKFYFIVRMFGAHAYTELLSCANEDIEFIENEEDEDISIQFIKRQHHKS